MHPCTPIPSKLLSHQAVFKKTSTNPRKKLPSFYLSETPVQMYWSKRRNVHQNMETIKILAKKPKTNLPLLKKFERAKKMKKTKHKDNISS